MPTITQYKEHYPNLSKDDIKLMHAARLAVQYSAWSLSHVRTVALTPVVLEIPPEASHLAVANALLASKSAYEEDILNYPRLQGNEKLLAVPRVPMPSAPGMALANSDWVVCKKVGYHSDDTDSDQYAYAFWCIKSTAPMTLMLGGNAYPMQDGQLVVFDARIPHALLSSDPNAAMVGIISSAALTPELREKMGIAWRRAANVSLKNLSAMERLQVDDSTGRFTGPSM